MRSIAKLFVFICCAVFFMPCAVQGESIQDLEARASGGDAEAQCELGRLYFAGEGVTKNPVKAVELLGQAADSGNAVAQNMLAFAYKHGEGVKKNPIKAFELWQKSAQYGNAAAQNNLAAAYMWGNGVEKNPTLAMEWWHKAAENGEVNAMVGLSLFYEGREEIAENLTKSFNFKLKAAELGHVESQERVADAFKDGAGVEKNLQEAKKWHDKAFQQILKFAENGDSEFQFKLANKYLYGRDGIEKNLKNGFFWLRKAAESGLIEAQAELGLLCTEASAGWPLKNSSYKNPDEARKWLYMAAEAGSSNAQRYLGVQFEFGNDGFEKNINEAIKWYRKAGENGDNSSLLSAKTLEDREKSKYEKANDYLVKNTKPASKNQNDTIQPKLALLIANSDYSQFGGLPNTLTDATLLVSVLQKIGFEITILKNANREEMLDAIKSFEKKIKGTAALAFFHYGGHGVQVDGKNYLIPANADIPDEARVSTRAVDLNEVMSALDSAKPQASIVVIDACRDNPLPGLVSRSATRGLAVVERKPRNSIIIYAAEAGSKARDGIFTPIFASALQMQNMSIDRIMKMVRVEVNKKTHGDQIPGEYNQLFEDIYLWGIPEGNAVDQASVPTYEPLKGDKNLILKNLLNSLKNDFLPILDQTIGSTSSGQKMQVPFNFKWGDTFSNAEKSLFDLSKTTETQIVGIDYQKNTKFLTVEKIPQKKLLRSVFIFEQNYLRAIEMHWGDNTWSKENYIKFYNEVKSNIDKKYGEGIPIARGSKCIDNTIINYEGFQWGEKSIGLGLFLFNAKENNQDHQIVLLRYNSKKTFD